jgi:hypothetical protein
VVDLAAIGLKVEVDAIEDSFAAIHEPKAPYDMKIGSGGPDTPDPATFLAEVLTEHMPSEWVPASLRGAADKVAAATAAERATGAEALANGLFAHEVPLAVYAYIVHGAFFAPSIGCLQFSPLGDLDLVALCPKR